MKSIKGPRSALSDFIEENGIRLKSVKMNTAVSEDVAVVKKNTKRQKKVCLSKPFEAVNLEVVQIKQEDREIEEIVDRLKKGEYQDNIDDAIRRKIAIYLSSRRMMNKFFFDLIVRLSDQHLAIFDCSMITDEDFIINKRLTSLELCQCGQLRSDTLNTILHGTPNLIKLRVTGAFLIENFTIPSSVEVLDVTNCSRLGDSFIENVNLQAKRLRELRLSHCYGLTKNAILSVDVEKLFICETKLSEKFISKPQILRQLSVKRCPNINNLPELENIEYLDIDGITSIMKLPSSKSIYHLNISYCYKIRMPLLDELKYLNVSHTCLNVENLETILRCSQLETLDVSWNSIIDDDVLQRIVDNLPLKKLYVFGCFGLTQASVNLASGIKNRCLIVGNPSETLYLLEN